VKARLGVLLTAAITALTVSPQAQAADARYPDWPCQQIKVPTLSVAAMWSGPPIDDVGNAWQEDAAVAELVATLAARRTPLDRADTLIADFLKGGGSEQQHKAKLLFAGLFDTLGRERAAVMDGIERFARKQRANAAQIRAEGTALRAEQIADQPDQGKVEDLTNRLSWDRRIYDEQRQTISYVCEVPQTIERRLFALSRSIQQALD
jgi:hypothetical protein